MDFSWYSKPLYASIWSSLKDLIRVCNNLLPERCLIESSQRPFTPYLLVPHLSPIYHDLAWVLSFYSIVVIRTSLKLRKSARTAVSSTPIRCEQSTQEGSSLDIWLGRLAMVGFAAAISVEVATGKGLLEVSKWSILLLKPLKSITCCSLVGLLRELS